MLARRCRYISGTLPQTDTVDSFRALAGCTLVFCNDAEVGRLGAAGTLRTLCRALWWGCKSSLLASTFPGIFVIAKEYREEFSAIPYAEDLPTCNTSTKVFRTVFSASIFWSITTCWKSRKLKEYISVLQVEPAEWDTSALRGAEGTLRGNYGPSRVVLHFHLRAYTLNSALLFPYFWVTFLSEHIPAALFGFGAD